MNNGSKPINKDDLYGVYNDSIKRRQRIEEQAVRKAWDIPADDGMRDFSVTHQYPGREKSTGEKLLFAAIVAAAAMTPVAGVVALPAIIDAMRPQVIQPPPADHTPPVQPLPAAVNNDTDTNDVFELGLHPPQN